MGTGKGSSSYEGKDSTDNSESDENEGEIQKLKGSKERWGKKKNYYAGDTADLEIGQDVQDAYDEEEAAMILQKERLESMRESDFLDDIKEIDEDESESMIEDSRRGGDERKRSVKDSLIGSLESVVLDEVSEHILFSILSLLTIA